MNSNSSIHSQLISKTVNKSNIQFIWQWINLFSNQPWPWITIHEWDPCLTLTFCQTTSTSNTSFLISFIAIMQLVPPNQAKNARGAWQKPTDTHKKKKRKLFSPLSLCHSFRMRWRRRVLLWGHNTTRARFTRPFRFIFAKKILGGGTKKFWKAHSHSICQTKEKKVPGNWEPLRGRVHSVRIRSLLS